MIGLEEVSTTCGSGWVSYTDQKSLAILHADHWPTRYRRWYWPLPSM